MKIIYELRIDHVDCYHALGFFETVDRLLYAVRGFDGPDGGPVAEGQIEGEVLTVHQHEIGAIDSCGCGGEPILTLRRTLRFRDDSDESYWHTEVATSWFAEFEDRI